MTIELQNMIDEYRSKSPGWSEQMRAQFEARIWQATPGNLRRGRSADIVLGEMTGCSSQSIGSRSRLLNAGKLGELLWPLVNDGEMPTRKAVALLIDSRRRADAEGIGADVALREDVAAYLALPIRYTTAGTKYRAKPPKTPFRKAKTSYAPPPSPKKRVPQADDDAALIVERGFWTAIRTQIADHVTASLEGVDAISTARIIDGLAAEIRSAIRTAQARIKQARETAAEKRSLGVVPVQRRDVVEACRTLHMQEPKMEQPADLAQAALQKKRFARIYHPDANGGNDATAAQYHAVIEAYETLSNYNESLNEAAESKADEPADPVH